MSQPQPPDQELLVGALDRADRLLSDAAAAWVKELITTLWNAHPEDGAHRAEHAAMGLLFHAAYWRKRNVPNLATIFDLAAEAFILGWADEITVRSEVAEALGLEPETTDIV